MYGNDEWAHNLQSGITIPHVPMVGKSGARDNVYVLLSVMSQVLPAGTVLDVVVEHDSPCPCYAHQSASSLQDCLCEQVDLVLRTVRPEDHDAAL